MLKPHRCYNCNKPFGIEFMSDGPQCPMCGSVGAPNVLRLTVVHFLAPDSEGSIHCLGGQRATIACMPGKKHYDAERHPRSPEVRAVSCPNCAKTEAFKLACIELAEVRGMSEQELQEEHPRLAGKGLLLVE